MPNLHRTPIVAVTLLLLGEAAESHDGFDFCAPPVVPSCIEQAARTRTKAEFHACGPRVLGFTQSLGAYRICLQRESERAVEAGNDAIARFRCLSLGRNFCGSQRDETER